MSFLIENWKDMLRRQDEPPGRQALTDDTTRAIMMDMCSAELERHLMLNPDRYDMYPKVKSAIKDDVEERTHQSKSTRWRIQPTKSTKETGSKRTP